MINLLLNRVERTIEPHKGPVSLHEPEFSKNEWAYVKETLDTGWVSSAGKYVPLFEQKLAEFTGAHFCVATVNGTCALQCCLKLVGVLPGDEVLVPTLTFVATANAVVHCGALPHFVDSDRRSLGVDAAKLRDYLKDAGRVENGVFINKATGRNIRALIVVHTFGHPADLFELKDVCDRFKITLVEDASEALGSYFDGHHVGLVGAIAALSFNGNKIVTTGGGGAILTHDDKLGPLAKHITTTAKVAHAWRFFHDQIGYNFRMPNLNAALGVAQLEKLNDFICRKRKLAQKYQEQLRDVEGIEIFKECPDRKSNYWLNAIFLKNADLRDSLLKSAHQRGLLIRPCWSLMHTLPMYIDCPRMDVTQSEAIERTLINLPSSAFLSSNET